MIPSPQAPYVPRGSPLICATIQYPILKTIYNLYLHPLSKVPGPPSWSASRLPFAHALIKGTLVQDLEKLHRQYGPVLRIAPDDVTFSHPDAWIDIFQGRPNHVYFPKDPVYWTQQLSPIPSVLGIYDLSAHARVRKQLAPDLTARAVRAQEPMIQRYVNLLVERLGKIVSADTTSQNIEVDMVQWFNFTTFDIIGDLGFGESFDCLENSLDLSHFQQREDGRIGVLGTVLSLYRFCAYQMHPALAEEDGSRPCTTNCGQGTTPA